ncbi:PLP-dependent aminotransferase family protein [Xanthobacter oligotrophicus]|uniref:aminotransferase-like domain-containing protein n=1 Tax=Xanthobacter oligotrophicus TaxID=2607286 RepID=UPI0011F106B7|nr:PLP-dependent aminotransferase family protein [Xanthobacter oligotrophicus]MCG5236800.1 PLP-dependent aminotransferase family protein [Xanthobacter oligotrophicus]
MKDWVPRIERIDGPRYRAIADAIAADIAAGVLVPGDQLPPQRRLATTLGVDFTTVARGYVEAGKRGLIESTVGRGSFVRRSASARPAADPQRARTSDFSMNMPPEPEDPELVARMQEGFASVARDLLPLLRYQGFGGSPQDKDAASAWLGRRALVPAQERIFISPGAHPALVGIFSLLAKAGETVLAEQITYPGVRAIAAQLGLTLVGIEMDQDGVLPEALEEAVRRHAPKAIYLNPTLQNPMTITTSERRRAAICAIARRTGVPIVEDDAYGFIASHGPPPLAAIAPDICWHIAGLAKCIGAGLRLAYVVAPDARAGWSFTGAMRAISVMASPLTAAVVTRWIDDGTADTILRFIRAEAAARQKIAARHFEPGTYLSDPLSFNVWLPLTNGWNRSAFAGHARATGVGIVPSDAFTVSGPPPEAVRVGLGGPIGRAQLERGLEFMAHALEGPAQITAGLY